MNPFIRHEVPKGMRPFTVVFKTLQPDDELLAYMRDLGNYLVIDQSSSPNLVDSPDQFPAWAGPWAWATLWISDYSESQQELIDELLIEIIDLLGDPFRVGQNQTRNMWLDKFARPCALLTYEEDQLVGRTNFEIRYGRP